VKKLAICLLLTLPGTLYAQSRAGTNEWSLDLFVVGTKHYAFEGGASARNEGGAGIGLTLTHNLNDYFAVGFDATLSEFDYRAGVAPGAGNAAAGFQSEGNMETAGLRFHATWNLLARPVTPFITAGAGVVFLDPNLESGPPANACWIYPWYGEVCGDKAPRGNLTRFTYGVGAGVRHDLPRDLGFVRISVGGEWIHFSEALSPVGYVQFRADFGLRF
jgi:opacity protein-like surface antigen